MEMLYQTAGSVRAEMSRAYKLLGTATLLFLIFIGTCCVPSQFTAKRLQEGVVVQKTQSSSKDSTSAGPGTLTVRHPDGTVAQIQTSASRYEKTEVGAKWDVMVSDSSLGKPMPIQHKILLAVLAISGLGSLIAFVLVLRSFDY